MMRFIVAAGQLLCCDDSSLLGKTRKSSLITENGAVSESLPSSLYQDLLWRSFPHVFSFTSSFLENVYGFLLGSS
jgi:hypothetical protein